MAKELNKHSLTIRMNRTLYQFIQKKAKEDKEDMSGVIRSIVKAELLRSEKNKKA